MAVVNGTAGNDVLNGTAAGDVIRGFEGHDALLAGAGADALIGGAGKDLLHGGSGADTLFGGSGNDTLVFDASDAGINGGTGTDVLRVSGAGVLVDLTAIPNTVIRDIEVIQLTGSGDNSLTLARADLLALSSTTNILRVDGNTGDSINAAGTWTFVGNVALGAQTYAEYASGGALLRVDTDIDRSGITAVQAVVELGSLDGTDGFRLVGASPYDYSGFSVSGAGDVNGDGFDDVIVGAHGATPHGPYSGASYVVFGAAGGLGSSINLANLNGTNGFKLSGGAAYDYSGISVSDAGDVNGDGFDDVIVGAYLAGTPGAYAGEAYVVLGKAGGFAPTVQLSNLNGANGFRLDGVSHYDYAGFSVSSAGDVNGDGFDDLVVGAHYASAGAPYSGASYVVFGKAASFGPVLELSNLNGANGFRIAGAADYDRSGYSVSSAGDVDGDGFDDLIIGAPDAGVFGDYAGAAYVVFGKAGGFATSINVANLNGVNGFELTGVADSDAAGIAVSGAGDVNGDGFDDVIVGASVAGTYGAYNGAAYVVFGKGGGFSPNVDLASLNGSNGFRLFGAADSDFTGASVSGAGDVNGDGFDDVIVGAHYASPNGIYSGASYVVFGAAGGFAANMRLSNLDGTDGFRLDGATPYDYAGVSVSAAGDVNGDGFDDLIVGAWGASPGGPASGASYVLYGGDFSGAVTHLGTNGADSITGTAAAETFVTDRGDDTVRGGGGADVIRTGAGDDIIFVSDMTFAVVDGGSGSDLLRLAGGGQTLDLTSANDGIDGIERINLTGSGDNTLELRARDLLDLSDSSNRLEVSGNAGDTVDLVGGWTAGAVAAGFQTYTLGAATILIDTDIFVT